MVRHEAFVVRLEVGDPCSALRLTTTEATTAPKGSSALVAARPIAIERTKAGYWLTMWRQLDMVEDWRFTDDVLAQLGILIRPINRPREVRPAFVNLRSIPTAANTV